MPSYSVSIRAIETEKHQVIDKRRNEILEEIEESKAFFQVVTLFALLSNFCCKPTQYFAYQSASNFFEISSSVFFFFLSFRCMMVPGIFIKGRLTKSKAWICLVRLLFVKRLIWSITLEQETAQIFVSSVVILYATFIMFIIIFSFSPYEVTKTESCSCMLWLSLSFQVYHDTSHK